MTIVWVALSSRYLPKHVSIPRTLPNSNTYPKPVATVINGVSRIYQIINNAHSNYIWS
jgi:hypothetical protein